MIPNTLFYCWFGYNPQIVGAYGRNFRFQRHGSFPFVERVALHDGTILEYIP